jgi:hypothetical protein
MNGQTEPVLDEIDMAAASEGQMMKRGFRSSRGLDVVGTIYKTAGIGKSNATGKTEKPVVNTREKRKEERRARIRAIKERMGNS